MMSTKQFTLLPLSSFSTDILGLICSFGANQKTQNGQCVHILYILVGEICLFGSMISMVDVKASRFNL